MFEYNHRPKGIHAAQGEARREEGGSARIARDDMFVVKDFSGVAALKYWLRNRKYNTFIRTIDANGKDIFGLIWDYHLGHFPSPSRRPRGLVLITDKTLEKAAALKVVAALSIETAYGKCFQMAQYDLWKYGIDVHKPFVPVLQKPL